MGFRSTLGAAVVVLSIASSAHAAEYSQNFKRPGAEVFAALTEALPSLGFKVKAADGVRQRVAFSAGMSAFSWGEIMSVAVVDKGEGESVLELDGELRMSTNVLAKGRILKHFNTIVMDVGRRLDQTPAEPPAVTP